MRRLIATGNVAEVFDLGERVLKLYKSPAAKPSAFREAGQHAAVEAVGLPVPRVWGVEQIDGRWGVIFDRIEEASFAARMQAALDAAPDYIDRMARLHLTIHGHRAAAFPSLKHRIAARIDAASILDQPTKQTLLQGLAELPDGDRLCHGDFHPLNILGDIDAPSIIDWPDATRGDPAADCCRSYLLLALHVADWAEPYLDAYCRHGNLGRAAVLAWLPFIAAARVSEEFPGELNRLLPLIGIDPNAGTPEQLNGQGC